MSAPIACLPFLDRLASFADRRAHGSPLQVADPETSRSVCCAASSSEAGEWRGDCHRPRVGPGRSPGSYPSKRVVTFHYNVQAIQVLDESSVTVGISRSGARAVHLDLGGRQSV